MPSKIKDPKGMLVLTLSFSSLLHSSLLDRQPGDIEVLTNLLIENYQNFREARQLGEESARFIRQEMEATWGQGHLAVLSEDEAQHWLLGVSGFSSGSSLILIPFKIL